QTACSVVPEVKQKVIQYKVRDELKSMNLAEHLPSAYEAMGVKLSLTSQNDYPHFKITGTLNYAVPVDLPAFVQAPLQQRLKQKSCQVLDKVKEQDAEIQHAIRQVVREDDVQVWLQVQDSEQKQLLQVRQHLTECGNLFAQNEQ
ncbi:MAG: hypothetical protein Q4D05_09630, partial [Acinetobacter sp.]|nr:hypothetical protein [Acinetobacter sp.]